MSDAADDAAAAAQHYAVLERHMIDEMTQDFADIVAAAIDGNERCISALATYSRFGPAPHMLAESLRP